MGLTPAPTESAHAMTHAVKLRPLVLDDLERVAGLAEKLVHLHHAFDEQRFFVPERVAEGYAWWFAKELTRDEVVLLVAEHEERVVGYVYARLEERDWNMLLDAAGAIHDIWVEPEARGLGVARALLVAAVDALRAKGAPRVVLHAAAKNTGAQELFKRLGFRETMIEMTLEL
jgi:ribosomal protein S18 acetylase RimI-like enzyme